LAFEELDKQSNVRGPEDGGVTIVVSPLIALMKDQVDALLRRNIKAACLDSTKTRDQFLQIQNDLRSGKLKLLYCAPERLNNEGFVESLMCIRGGVRLVAVDEAHCISEVILYLMVYTSITDGYSVGPCFSARLFEGYSSLLLASRHEISGNVLT
jgi:hypothetical protein